MTRAAGRHFLQIPGPTNVPDRVLRAIDFPTMDHRSPDFGLLGKEVGDVVKIQIPGGLKEFEILKFTTIHEMTEP